MNENEFLTKEFPMWQSLPMPSLIEEEKFLTKTETDYVLSHLPPEGNMLSLDGLNLNWSP